MIATISLSVVYFKILSVGTYIPMVYFNYKYPVLDKLIEHKIYKKYEKSFTNKYPKLSRGIHLIGCTVNKSTEFMTKIAIRQIQNYKNIDICHKQLSKALVHTSIAYKLLLPVYIYTSYSLAKKYVK